MRWAWVRPGGNPDIPTLLRKARAWGLERLVWDANDPQIDPANIRFNGLTYLQEFRRQGAANGSVVGPGIKLSPDWDGGRYAAAVPFAERASWFLSYHGFGSTTNRDSCVMELNREIPHDAADQLAMLKRWRELRWSRWTLWTIEAHQEGWFSPELVSFLRADPNLWVAGELYLGDDHQNWPVSERYVCNDLENALDRGQVKAVYNGAERVPYGWDGIIFDLARLPDKPPFPL